MCVCVFCVSVSVRVSVSVYVLCPCVFVCVLSYLFILDLQAAEWVPSTITSVKKKQEDSDAIEDKLGSAFERIKKTVQVSAYSVCV